MRRWLHAHFGFGSKHGQVHQKQNKKTKKLQYIKTINFFSQILNINNKLLFNFFFMVPFIVVLGTQIKNIKMRFSDLSLDILLKR